MFWTGERPFSCNLCDRAFTYKQGLKLHLLAHLGGRLYTSKKELDEYIIAHGLFGTPEQSASLSQKDSDAAVVSSSTQNPSNTSNPCAIGDGNLIDVVESLSSSLPQQSQEVLKSSSVGQLSVTSDLFGCADTVNASRAKELLSDNKFQESKKVKQQQSSLTYKNYNKDYFDAMYFRHIPPLIPI